MRRAVAFGVLAAILALGACHSRVDGGRGPAVQDDKLADLPKPLPEPYDEGATPAAMNARLDAAFAEAKAGGKRVVVDLGGNWCIWCRELDAVFEKPEVKPFMDANFVVVPVDVTSVEGPVDRNQAVLTRLGVGKVDGFPWLVVADADGKVLVSTDAVTDEKHQTPQEMVDWLGQYATKPAHG